MHTEELVSSVPGAPHLWNTWMDAAKPPHTLQSLCTAMVLPPAAAKVLLLNLYLGQNPNSHQNLTYFFPSSPKPLHASREESSPTGVLQNISLFSCFGLVIFSLAGLFFNAAKSHSHCLCNQGSALSWNPVSSFKASEIFVYLFTSQEDAASCLCQYKIVNNVSKDKEK